MTDMQRIRGRISELGTTQERVAVLIGIDAGALSRHLNGLRKPHKGTLNRIHRALDAIEEAEAAADVARRKVLDRHEREWERERQARMKELEHAVLHRRARHSGRHEQPEGCGEAHATVKAKVAS